MHAIERLRWVAGARWAPAGELAAEAAWALNELAEEEPVAMVPACRRLLDRHPGCGPMWWVAATVLTAGDPAAAAAECAERLLEDPTEDLLPGMLPAGARAVRRGSVADVVGADLVLVTVDAIAAGGAVAAGGTVVEGGAVVDGGAASLLAAAVEVGVPAWAVAGVGRVLPSRLWSVLRDRLGSGDGGARRDTEVVPLDGIAMVAGPAGAHPLEVALARPGCPEPPELLGGRQRWR